MKKSKANSTPKSSKSKKSQKPQNPWQPIGGTSRRYLNVLTGETISRHQRDKLISEYRNKTFVPFDQPKKLQPPKISRETVPATLPNLWEKLPNSKQRRNKRTGEVVSYRYYIMSTQRMTLEEKAIGNKKLGKTPLGVYNSLIASFKQVKKAEGLKPSEIHIKGSKAGEFKKLLLDLKDPSNAWDGPKAQALVKLGRRDAEWQFDVGMTPIPELLEGKGGKK